MTMVLHNQKTGKKTSPQVESPQNITRHSHICCTVTSGTSVTSRARERRCEWRSQVFYSALTELSNPKAQHHMHLPLYLTTELTTALLSSAHCWQSQGWSGDSTFQPRIRAVDGESLSCKWSARTSRGKQSLNVWNQIIVLFILLFSFSVISLWAELSLLSEKTCKAQPSMRNFACMFVAENACANSQEIRTWLESPFLPLRKK